MLTQRMRLEQEGVSTAAGPQCRLAQYRLEPTRRPRPVVIARARG